MIVQVKENGMMPSTGITENLSIHKVQGKENRQLEDELIKEHCLKVFYDGQQHKHACTGILLKALAVGNLYTALGINVMNGEYEIKLDQGASESSIYILQKPDAQLKENRPEHSAFKDFAFEGSRVMAEMRAFSRQSELFLRTGNMHSAAFVGCDGTRLFAEDIGRHNALDKLVGLSLMQKVELSRGMFLLSGRVPSDMMQKLIACGAKMAVSVSAPTYDSVQLAKVHQITLAGFARADKMNIYSHDYRITL